jgi:branched-chain amino acid transport system substrate-binding protein
VGVVELRRAGALLAVMALVSACGGGGSKPAANATATATAKAGAKLTPAWRPGHVTFGVLAPLSGRDGARGQDLVDGAKMAVTDVNIRGGVLGERAAVVTADDGCNAASATAGAKRLSQDSRHVAGVLGGVCDAAAGAAARTLAADDLGFIVTSANAPAIVSPKQTPTAYLLNGTPYQEALAVVHWLTYVSAQRLAVVTDGSAASKFLAKQVIGLTAPAPKPVSQQNLAAGNRDWKSIATIALASKPDFVYWAGDAESSGKLVAALRAGGYTGHFIASAQSESPDFLAAAGDAAEGAYVVTTASPQNLPAAADWTKRFTKAYGHAPGRDAMQAYDALRALAQAVTQTGKVDPALNSAQVPRLEDSYSTFLGNLAFAPDHTIRDDNHIVLIVKGGAFTVANLLRSTD